MSKQSKNLLLQSKKAVLFTFFVIATFFSRAQVANCIANGSFEEKYACTFPYDLRKVKNWLSTDSSNSTSGGFLSVCNGYVPSNGSAYQYPKSGDTYIIATFYLPDYGRGYLKNRLKSTLQPGKTYCVKFHVNITNMSPRGMDGFGIYFGDNSIDTISKCNVPLTYLTPQVSNPLGNVISDTLNWIPITGTFTANGTEKFALIGNFLPDNAVTTASINTPYYPQVWTDVLIDDVSCIDIDLPAYAGRDTSAVTGNTVYIGRPRDVGIDEVCTWYKLPNTNSVIATAAGLTVSAIGSATYVVRQQICGNVKWDTVVVKEDPLGIVATSNNNYRNFKLSPNPVTDQVCIYASQPNQFLSVTIFDLAGRVVLNRELKLEGAISKLDLNLLNGAYIFRIVDQNSQLEIQKLIIAK